MARRSLINAASKGLKEKKVRAGKVAQQLADSKFMGGEPEVAGRRLQGVEMLRVLNWYNYMHSRTDAREFIETYLKAHGRLTDIRVMKQVPDAWVNLQAGWYARIMTRGGTVSKEVFEQRLAEMLAKAGAKTEDEEQAEKPKAAEKPKLSIQDRIADKTSDTIGELDELIDEKGWTIDVYDWLTKKQVTPAAARKIREFFKPIADEAMELNSARAVGGRNVDKQLLEGYAYLTKAQVKERAVFYMKLITDCERFVDVAKKQKAPRRKKAVPAEKKIKDLQYQLESKDYKLASIKPEKIIGSQELWTFNSRYRTLTVFYALTKDGLDVQGTTIKGYDAERSATYRVGRKTDEHLSTALRGAKRAINKMLDGLTRIAIQHRVNENTVLLRVE